MWRPPEVCFYPRHFYFRRALWNHRKYRAWTYPLRTHSPNRYPYRPFPHGGTIHGYHGMVVRTRMTRSRLPQLPRLRHTFCRHWSRSCFCPYWRSELSCQDGLRTVYYFARKMQFQYILGNKNNTVPPHRYIARLILKFYSSPLLRKAQGRSIWLLTTSAPQYGQAERVHLLFQAQPVAFRADIDIL